MAYSDLAVEDQILIAAEFVGRGVTVPHEIREALGPGLMGDIEHPEMNIDQPEEPQRSRYR